MRYVLIISTLFLLTYMPAWAQKDMKATVLAANQAFMDAYAKGAVGMGSFYTTDALLMNANGEAIQGNVAIGKFYKDAFDSGMKRLKLEVIEAEQQGNVLIERGRFTAYGANDTQLDTGKYIVIWKQENGSWKLHRDIGNTSMPAH
jgi:ketosteroid isomerase-like protein